MNWTWKENSILNNYTGTTPCKDIFHAVCEEIGRYYEQTGWKYSRSRPKITFKNKEIKVEVAFWSSGSNMSGSYVNLEIIPAISSLELIEHMKSKGINTKGYILGLSDLFSEYKRDIPKGTQRVVNVLGEVNEFEEKYEEAGVLRYNHNVNVYGLKESDFVKIIKLINDRILVWIDWIHNFEKLQELTEKSVGYGRRIMKEGEFQRFIDFKYPERSNDIRLLLE